MIWLRDKQGGGPWIEEKNRTWVQVHLQVTVKLNVTGGKHSLGCYRL